MKQPFAGFFIVLAAALLASAGAAGQGEGSGFTENAMNIRLIVDGAVLRATLEDNAASRDFAALLPLELTLSDYHGIEKIADLPSRLSTDGVPEGVDPEIGDITYYAPWGNLALFYGDFGYARGLVRLGRIQGGVERLADSDTVDVRIERVEAAQ